MAQPTGGYDCNFVEDPPDALKCLICLMVVREPQQHGECGKLFCKSCITQHQTLNTTCPNCRQSLRAGIFNDFRSSQEVKSLQVKCTKGCSWAGELRSLEDHLLNVCEKVLLPCPNKCDKGSKEILRANLQFHLENKCPRRQYPCPQCGQTDEYQNYRNHLQNKCPKRQYPCPHCGESGQYDEQTTTHVKICPKVEVQCPKCLISYFRCAAPKHVYSCMFEPASCKYAEVGCEERPLRKDLKKHEEDDQLHLRITTAKVLEQNKAINLLERRISNWSFNFKMTDYQEKKKSEELYISPPFHTHPNGYKMCIGVYASGFGAVKGTHVSVYACLMKGDNDDSLTWPFTGSVTIELLNQLEDDNHYKKTIPFTADNDTSKRVVDGERGRGYGRPEFIPHTDLDHKTDKNGQYLKDDTLIFRITVQVPDYKPWLECTN